LTCVAGEGVRGLDIRLGGDLGRHGAGGGQCICADVVVVKGRKGSRRGEMEE
jgi:hypothetical protein